MDPQSLIHVTWNFLWPELVGSKVSYLLGSIQDLMEYWTRCDIEAPNKVGEKKNISAFGQEGLLGKRSKGQVHRGAQERTARSRPTATDPGRTQKRGKVMFWAQQLSFSLIC